MEGLQSSRHIDINPFLGSRLLHPLPDGGVLLFPGDQTVRVFSLSRTTSALLHIPDEAGDLPQKGSLLQVSEDLVFATGLRNDQCSSTCERDESS